MFEHKFIENLDCEIDIPSKGIVSHTLFQNKSLRTVAFGFAQGEIMSEHTARVPAVVYVVDGEAEFDLNGTRSMLKPGSWLYMDPDLPHSVEAKTDLKFILHLLRGKA